MDQLFEELSDADFKIFPHGSGSTIRLVAPNGELRFVSKNATLPTTVKNLRRWAQRNGLPRPEDVKKIEEATEEPVVPAPNPSMMPSRNRVAEPAVERIVPEETPIPEVAPSAVGPVLPEGHPALPAPGVRIFPKAGDGVWEEPDRPIDPDMASHMLEYNHENRPPQMRLVESWARTMRENGWVEDIGDPIRFSNTGRLLDGQKRLMAVEKSGRAIRFNVITGLPDSSQDVMDSGQHRSVADQLKINGYKNAMIIASSARMLWLWEHGALISNLPTPSNIEVLDYILTLSNGDHSIEDSAHVAAGSQARQFIAPSVVAGCHYRMSLVDSKAASEFFDYLDHGANMPLRSPILALRDTMTRRVGGRDRRPNQAQQVYLVCRAWTLWRKGAQASKMQLPPKGSLSMSQISLIS